MRIFPENFLYGQATRFTVKPSNAADVTRRDAHGFQHLLYCRVLVGDFVPFGSRRNGEGSFAAPLKNETEWSSYDSEASFDSKGNMQEVFAFDPDQVYPQFHVRYKLK